MRALIVSIVSIEAFDVTVPIAVPGPLILAIRQGIEEGRCVKSARLKVHEQGLVAGWVGVMNIHDVVNAVAGDALCGGTNRSKSRMSNRRRHFMAASFRE
jgi:hypothetical protein